MCGIAGVWLPKGAEGKGFNAAEILANMTAGQQHRGHEGAGIVTTKHGEENDFLIHKGMGLIFEVFHPEVLRGLAGACGIAQNRYSTTGKPSLVNTQPFNSVFRTGKGTEQIAVAHNGNLTSELFGLSPGTSDTWQILENFGQANPDQEIKVRIFQTLKGLEGSFSLIFLYQNAEGKVSLVCARDSHGFRPLWLAILKIGEKEAGYLAASETSAFGKIKGAEILRPVYPGEIVAINEEGISSFKPAAWQNMRLARCIFEIIYFMHPTSILETENFATDPLFVWEVQEALGRKLASENEGLVADIVSEVPDSSKFHTLGFSRQSGLPHDVGIIRNHAVGRTFLTPSIISKELSTNREDKIFRKFSFMWKKLQQIARIISGEDSLVRGNTLRGIVSHIKSSCSELEIVAVIASPAIKYPCFFGIDIPTKKELAWNKWGGLEGVKKKIGLTDLRYLSLEGLLEVAVEITGHHGNSWCSACFSGEYPVDILRPEQQREIN
jgi:amidophosphoribosyltransferase